MKYNVCVIEKDKGIIKSPISSSLINLKNKVNSTEHVSFGEFHENLKKILKLAKSRELYQIYNTILKQLFPWYDPNETGSELKSSFHDTSNIGSARPETNIPIILENPKYRLIENIKNDTRICALCRGVGDGLENEEARLLYCGSNIWIHANCALWSSEVYEEIDGSLQNVHVAISHSRLLRCKHCKQKGASIGCCVRSCPEIYHFACARAVKCYFMSDRTIYCQAHGSTTNVAVISSSTDFAIHRSMYVEISKKKRLVDSKNVQFMSGSLCVTSLGIIVPSVSDTEEVIIPTDFSCYRVFWSINEPWKLIPYTIKTHLINTQTNTKLADKNFTIDHNLSSSITDKILEEIAMWQKDSEITSSTCVELEEEEEPQNENATDILSPELTDAILEELPHEFLDGISMQDILPKLLNNEELPCDFKGTDSELRPNDTILQVNEQKKGNIVDDIKDTNYIFSETNNVKDFKESKTDLVVQQLQSKVKNRQYSCSMTLSCKSNESPTKQNKSGSSLKNNMCVQLDGAYDNSSSSDSESMNNDKEDTWFSEISDEPVKCQRCQCTYRTQASYKRHLEICEVMSTSESDSDLASMDEPMTVVGINSEVASSFETFRTCEVTQNEALSTSDTHYLNSQSAAESFYSDFQSDSESKCLPPSFTQNTSLSIHQLESPTTGIEQPSNNSICESAQVTVDCNHHTLADQTINQSNELHVNQTPSLYVNQPNCGTIIDQPNTISFIQPSPLQVTPASISINQAGAISLNTSTTPFQPMKLPSQQLTIQSVPIAQSVPQTLNLTSPNLITQTITIPQNQVLKSPIQRTINPPRPRIVKQRSRSLATRTARPRGRRPVLIPQACQTNPPVIFQHLPSTTMIPNFIETLQQQTGRNMQYISTITPQITPALSTQSQIFQIQPDGTLINLMPGVQPAVILPQPRILSDQLIVDNNGSLVWTPQPVQPIFYGYETIVQNTVLQSQQFLPSAVPGVLTTNSSYSTTTQVFQTSKLEPVLDVTSGNIMLLNSGSVVNSQSFPVTQNVSNQISASPLIISEAKPSVSWGYIGASNTSLESQSNSLPATVSTPTSSNVNNINLPVAPFISESGLPTNRVTPTSKLISATAQVRPMSRVLPMPTNNSKQNKASIKNAIIEKHVASDKTENNKDNIENNVQKHPVVTILDDVIIKPVVKSPEDLGKVTPNAISPKEETASIKLSFQKENDGGFYKIGNNFNANNSSVQVVPLKPMKTKSINIQQYLALENNTLEKDKVSNLQTYSSKNNLKPERKPLHEKQEECILYTVETQDGFHYSSNSLTEMWTKVVESVQSARVAHNMPPLPSTSLNTLSGVQLIGLNNNGLKYLLEQLPGAAKCAKYKPVFHPRTQDTDGEDLELYQTGAARTRRFRRSNEPHDMFGWVTSKHRKPPEYNKHSVRRGSGMVSPISVRFQQLKLAYKKSVGVYRSKIHKRGLFCHRTIESGEMVIEYAGEVIRSILADKREKEYTAKGMGCYMFRIDENLVVDATMMGNAARFINHSCEPNCYSKVVEISGHKHIVIFALRKILRGEELTYDYKFPFEEDKIPCTCASDRCKKFLN